MNDINNMKNLKALEEEEVKEEKKEEPKKYAFSNESEIIVNQIFEKLISLVITLSLRNKIENLLPNYCFEDLKQFLEILTNLDFLTHDKNDLAPKKNISSKYKISHFKKK